MDTVDKKADLFVDKLLTEGAQIPCDDSVDSFNDNEALPPFFDEDEIKSAQCFFHKHIFGLFAGKIFGLIAVLAIPSILKILIHTRMSGSDLTAYKRYMATIWHMTVWYDSDFKPGSKLWRSISEVKGLHNAASKRGCKAGLNRISQRDMALTQFGFMGFQLIRSGYFGVKASADEWKAFIHLWRVIGHILGIEDRFNICKETVAETKAICEKLVDRVFLPHVKKQDSEYLQMSRYLVNGLWTIQPLLNFNVVMYSLNILLTNNMNINNNENGNYIKLTFFEKCLLYFIGFSFYSLRWAPFRWYFNYTRRRDFWLMRNFPFLAYYKFGYEHSHVKILDEKKL